MAFMVFMGQEDHFNMEIKRIVTSSGKNLKHNLTLLDNKVGKVGWFEGSKYPDKKHTPVAYIAAQNECGNPSKHIPARPFMRPTIKEKNAEWQTLAFDGSKRIIEKGDIDIGDVLLLIGARAVGEIQKKISDIQTPPLSPITIKRRLEKYKDKKTIGSLTKPLIDTGYMLATITNVIESK